MAGTLKMDGIRTRWMQIIARHFALNVTLQKQERHGNKSINQKYKTVEMEVYADFRQKVQINPKDVIEKLIEKEVGSNWIFEKDGKFYLCYEQSAGCNTFDVEDEITEERYRYVEALQFILKRLN